MPMRAAWRGECRTKRLSPNSLLATRFGGNAMQNRITLRTSFFRCVVAGGAILGGVLPAAAAPIARVDLGGPWQVAKEGSGETIAATVPGYIHTDLLAAKKI